ncbi:hypothetical protein ILYODFUR_024910 [Ilyodon furcidens]|uniref:Uncharacterized protein n=1 Tax=Ilyodon furcidens TaxID=33524 RepID=A0ABV0UV10_9TELE
MYDLNKTERWSLRMMPTAAYFSLTPSGALSTSSHFLTHQSPACGPSTPKPDHSFWVLNRFCISCVNGYASLMSEVRGGFADWCQVKERQQKLNLPLITSKVGTIISEHTSKPDVDGL